MMPCTGRPSWLCRPPKPVRHPGTSGRQRRAPPTLGILGQEIHDRLRQFRAGRHLGLRCRAALACGCVGVGRCAGHSFSSRGRASRATVSRRWCQTSRRGPTWTCSRATCRAHSTHSGQRHCSAHKCLQPCSPGCSVHCGLPRLSGAALRVEQRRECALGHRLI